MEPITTGTAPGAGPGSPCVVCAQKGGTAGLSLVCSRCKVVCYCCSEHQREDWLRHKKMCASLGKHASTLKIVFDILGLFTDGSEFFAVAMVRSGTAKEFREMGRQMKALQSAQWDQMTALIADSLASIDMTPKDLMDPPLCLGQLGARYLHSKIWGLIHPVDIRRICDRARELGLKQIDFPAAGEAWLPLFFWMFGDWPLADMYCSDIDPRDGAPLVKVWRSDASDAIRKASGPGRLVVLSWPDQSGAPEISRGIIQACRDLAVEHLLVLHEVPGCAISEEGHASLDRGFKPAADFKILSFNITAGGLKLITKKSGISLDFVPPAMRGFYDTVGQFTTWYERR